LEAASAWNIQQPLRPRRESVRDLHDVLQSAAIEELEKPPAVVAACGYRQGLRNL